MSNKSENIKRFLRDPGTSDVKEVIMSTFLKPRGTDITLLAAERLAINLLEEAFGELEKYKVEEKISEKKITQIGL